MKGPMFEFLILRFVEMAVYEDNDVLVKKILRR